MSSSPSQPLAGRRIWIAGIGGAGHERLRAARARLGRRGRRLGSRRDAVPRSTSRASTVDDRAGAAAAAGRLGGRTSRPRSPAASPGGRGAELLAELVSLRRSIVVAGAHGKTTTSAMIAFCLDRLGLDPAFLIGGEVAAARRQRARRARAGSSSRATSPTARSPRCARRSPCS